MDIFRTFDHFTKVFISGILVLVFSNAFSQSPPPYTVDFLNGIATPIGEFNNFSEPGFKSGIGISKQFCNKLSLGINTDYTAFSVKNSLGTFNEKWNYTSLSVGPQYKINFKNTFAQLYGRFGMSFINTPSNTEYYPQTNLITTQFQAYESNALYTRFGLNLGVEICEGLSFMISADYSTHLYSNINYQSRNLSSAIDAKGQLDPDLASAIAFENRNFSLTSFNINFGMRIALNKRQNKAGTRATDYNSSRSNKNGSKSPDATDYNSSRSNKSEDSGVIDNNNGGNNDDDKGTKATDYNSSRSNKNGSKSPDATDYNSSRSNKSEDSGVIDNNNGGNNDDDKGTKATDYNSSRSNKNTNKPN